jgi:hypothetical protein
MPRLTNQTYINHCHYLRQLWLQANQTYARLSPTEQWNLHDYYQPAKDLTDQQRLQHRNDISKQRPALPAQAGKAFHRLQAGASVPPTRHGHILLRSVVQPELNVDEFVAALLAIAEQLQREGPHQEPDDPRRGDIEDRAA